MWKAPNRPKHEITQAFNDGIVTICTVCDAAKAGYAPQEKLTDQSKQAQVEIVRVIRVPAAGAVSPQDVALLEGKQYRIDTVQKVMEIYPPCVDLALAKIEQKFEVMA